MFILAMLYRFKEVKANHVLISLFDLVLKKFYDSAKVYKSSTTQKHIPCSICFVIKRVVEAVEVF